MTDLTKRRLSIVGAVLVVLAAIGGQRFLASQKKEAPRKEAAVKLKQAETMPVELVSIPTTLDVEGQLAAFDKIDLYSEIGGMVESTARTFKIGTYFPKGSALLKVDDSEARLALLAQKSTLLNAIAQAMPDLKIDYPESFPAWEAYLNAFNVEDDIKALPDPQTDQEKRFIAARNLYTQYYNIKSQEQRLDKYTLYAPFSGVLTAADVQIGTVIRSGQKLGELMANGNYELVATVPLSDLNYLNAGSTVELFSEDIAGQWQGRVKRISDQIDPGSQTVQVFISVGGKDLREGMYMRGEVASREVNNAMRIPRDLLVDQTGVYVIQDSLLLLRTVNVIKMEAETVIVQGLRPQQHLLAKPLPGAFDSMRVAPVVNQATSSTDLETAAPIGMNQ
ncbi:MAG: efflux RND transporter periplasmic adaptor subunit [Bacteroidota bacterium]